MIAGLLAVLTVVSVGPAAPAAVVLFLLSANALGSMALRKTETVEDQVCATLLGTGVYTFLMTFACRVPVNYPAVWGIVLAAPIAAGLAGRAAARGGMAGTPARPPPRRCSRLLVFVLLAHWVVALKPEASADGLAMHLSIPANIAMEHRLTLEPARFVWAVMPMATDFAYAVVYQLGGEFAARLLVFAMLLAVCALLYRTLRRWTSPSAAYLLTAVFAATPIVQLVTGALFVENFVAAMILGTLTAIWRFGDTGDRRYFFAAMAIGGTAMSAKIGALGVRADRAAVRLPRGAPALEVDGARGRLRLARPGWSCCSSGGAAVRRRLREDPEPVVSLSDKDLAVACDAGGLRYPGRAFQEAAVGPNACSTSRSTRTNTMRASAGRSGSTG